MSLLILRRAKLSPCSTSSPEVRRSVAINEAVVRPRVRIHFVSRECRWKGEVQMTLWSFNMLTSNFLRKLGVGVACGFDGISGVDVWADAKCAERKNMTKAKAHQAPGGASERLVFIEGSEILQGELTDYACSGDIRQTCAPWHRSGCGRLINGSNSSRICGSSKAPSTTEPSPYRARFCSA